MTYESVPIALIMPYFELSPQSFLFIKPSARGLRHQKKPFRKKAATTTIGKLSDKRKGKESVIENMPQRIIISFVFPLLSERDEIKRGIMMAESWQRAIREPERECEYPLFLKIICKYGEKDAIEACVSIERMKSCMSRIMNRGVPHFKIISRKKDLLFSIFHIYNQIASMSLH